LLANKIAHVVYSILTGKTQQTAGKRSKEPATI
jgi:hypothetical protein